jgi:RNase P/RNase MRP subunit POP5
VVRIVGTKNRRRYIGFMVQPHDKKVRIHRADLIKELNHCCQQIFKRESHEFGIRLIRFNGTIGIIRCTHRTKEQTIQLLSSLSTINTHKIAVTTLGTSGTIRALIQKHLPEELH